MASTADLWTETFSDSKGVVRCKRCNHARPSQPAAVGQVAIPTQLDDNGTGGLLQALTSASLLMSNPRASSQPKLPADPQLEKEQ